MKKSNRTDWERLKKISDDEINYSDISETNADFWDDAKVMKLELKTEIKIKIDEDIALWIKQLGINSDTAINTMLRSYFIGINSFKEKQHINI